MMYTLPSHLINGMVTTLTDLLMAGYKQLIKITYATAINNNIMMAGTDLHT